MNEPQFDSPLDDALDDFRLWFESATGQKGHRMHMADAFQKLVAYTRELEARVQALEDQQNSEARS